MFRKKKIDNKATLSTENNADLINNEALPPYDAAEFVDIDHVPPPDYGNSQPSSKEPIRTSSKSLSNDYDVDDDYGHTKAYGKLHSFTTTRVDDSSAARTIKKKKKAQQSVDATAAELSQIYMNVPVNNDRNANSSYYENMPEDVADAVRARDSLYENSEEAIDQAMHETLAAAAAAASVVTAAKVTLRQQSDDYSTSSEDSTARSVPDLLYANVSTKPSVVEEQHVASPFLPASESKSANSSEIYVNSERSVVKKRLNSQPAKNNPEDSADIYVNVPYSGCSKNSQSSAGEPAKDLHGAIPNTSSSLYQNLDDVDLIEPVSMECLAYFWGKVDKELVADFLRDECVDGQFLLRESTRARGLYAISCKLAGDVVNYSINYDPVQKVYWFYKDKKHRSIPDVVESLRSVGLTLADGKWCCLTEPLCSSVPNEHTGLYPWQRDPKTGKRLCSHARLSAYPWYHGRRSRTEAVTLLLANGKDGNFMLRESESQPGTFAISVRVNGSVASFLIQKDMNQNYYLGKSFHVSIPNLVAYYKKNGIQLPDSDVLEVHEAYELHIDPDGHDDYDVCARAYTVALLNSETFKETQMTPEDWNKYLHLSCHLAENLQLKSHVPETNLDEPFFEQTQQLHLRLGKTVSALIEEHRKTNKYTYHDLPNINEVRRARMKKSVALNGDEGNNEVNFETDFFASQVAAKEKLYVNLLN